MTTRLTEAGQKLADALVKAGVLTGYLPDSRVAKLNTAAQILLTPEGGGGLREAAENAEMYLRTGFIPCERCGHEQPTANTDAEYTLRNALAALAPKTSVPGNDAGMREALGEINVHEEAENYELRADGDYTPNDFEKSLLEDFGAGLMGKVYAALSPQPPKADFASSRSEGMEPKAETPAGVGEAPKAATVEWLEKRIDAAERDSNAHPEGHSNRSFYAGQAVAYENALSFILDRSLAPAARAGDGVEREITTLLAEKKPSIESSGDFVGVTFDLSGEARQFAQLLAKAALTAAPAANGDGA